MTTSAPTRTAPKQLPSRKVRLTCPTFGGQSTDPFMLSLNLRWHGLPAWAKNTPAVKSEALLWWLAISGSWSQVNVRPRFWGKAVIAAISVRHEAQLAHARIIKLSEQHRSDGQMIQANVRRVH